MNKLERSRLDKLKTVAKNEQKCIDIQLHYVKCESVTEFLDKIQDGKIDASYHMTDDMLSHIIAYCKTQQKILEETERSFR